MLSDEHDPVNIGNPQETTIRDFALLINEITGNTAGVASRFTDGLGNDPQQRQPDITRARQLLGWEPQVDIRIGLKETIAYFRTKIG